MKLFGTHSVVPDILSFVSVTHINLQHMIHTNSAIDIKYGDIAHVHLSKHGKEDVGNVSFSGFQHGFEAEKYYLKSLCFQLTSILSSLRRLYPFSLVLSTHGVMWVSS